MYLYWFADEDGGVWEVVVAKDETKAWQCLASDQKESIEKIKEKFDLEAETHITDREGVIATIFPHEVNFYIKEQV